MTMIAPLTSQPLHYGIVMIIIGVSFIAMSGLLGIAMDLGDLYIHKTEFQSAADAAANVGARQMNGQESGLYAAASRAVLAADSLLSVASCQIEIHFGTTRDGPWSNLTAARAHPGDMRYIRVDTGDLIRMERPVWQLPQFDPAPVSTAASGMAIAEAAIANLGS